MLLVCADDVNLADKNIYAIKKNTKAQLVTSEEVILEVNAEKTK
jgi:hypothetical protein